MKKNAIGFLLALCGLIYAADDWAVFRGPGQDSTLKTSDAFKDGFGLELAYIIEAGSGYSSVSIQSGTAVHMYSDGTHDRVTAFDAKSGKQIWTYQIAEHYKGHDGSHDGTIATPAIANNKVFGLSAHGALFALDLKSGQEIWRKDITKDLNGVSPSYGYSSSPTIVGDILIVQTGGENAAISGLKTSDGSVVWTAGNDKVSYQSPVYTQFMGKKQLIASSDNKMFGLNPKDGSVNWEFEHGHKTEIYDPVIVGENRIFVKIGTGGKMLEAKDEASKVSFSEVWSGINIRSNNITVHHDGYLYGYSGRFLTCLNASNGERVWKSRQPGDGFLSLIDGHLVIITKSGTLHVAEASPEGYKEKSSIKVFDSLAWTPPSFANGHIFVRNLKSMAAIRVGIEKVTQLAQDKEKHGLAPDSEFGEWVKKVESSSDKNALVDSFMAEQKSFPIVGKDGYVHIIYRGDAPDVAVTGDFLENGTEHQMNKVQGTDLRYYSFKLGNDAHIAYQMAIDFERPAADPLNPRQANGFGEDTFSMVTMPNSKFTFPKNSEMQGKVEEIEFESTVTGTKRKAWVYLPSSYDANASGYPTAYFSYGKFAYESGKVNLALDQANGKSITPTIAIFIDLHPEKGFEEMRGENEKLYIQMIAEELVPEIDKRFNTMKSSQSRASFGYSTSGYTALELALRHPEVFGKVATFSVRMDATREEELTELLKSGAKKPEVMMSWGKYDLRNTSNELDFPAANKKLYEQLKAGGIQVSGGETPTGYGWANWGAQTATVMEELFPINMTN